MQEKQQFFMTGLRFLSKSNIQELDYRIKLWRNTIQLFHEYKKSNFIGPFKAAGFKYKIETFLLTKEEGEDIKPDIVASSENGWLILDLTASSNSKKLRLDKYTTIDSRDLGQYGLLTHNKKPDVMTSRLTFIDDGPYCQIIVSDNLKVEKEDYIQNEILKDKLIKSKNIKLKELPEIPITLLPEMKSSNEIRRGLIDIVLQIFDPNCEGKTPVEIVDEGLERLVDKIGPSPRKRLIDRVKYQMDILIRNHLKGFLEFKDEKYQVTEKFKQHHRTFEFISLKLKEWAGWKAPTTLEDF